MSTTTDTNSMRRKSSTRSSIRQSLNFAGKALVDVINSKDSTAKKSKEPGSRRLSGVVASKPLAATAPRASMGDARLPGPFNLKTETPESKTITRRRTSALHRALLPDEKPAQSSESAISPQLGGGVALTRTTSLRPRTNGNVSSLPKYRPRSVIIDNPKRAASPIRPPSRKRVSSSEDDDADMIKIKSPRPNSAQSAAFAVDLPTAQSTPPAKEKGKTKAAQAKPKASPSRLVKTAKPAPAATAIPRPPSSSSSSSSFVPHTPKVAAPKNAMGFSRATGGRAQAPSPLGPSTNAKVEAPPESPLSKHSRKKSSSSSSRKVEASPETPVAANMSHISEGVNEDSMEVDDVAALLAPVASPTAPTPAMPRIQPSHNHRQRIAPQTPTRNNLLPSRSNLSYLSPLPPDSDSDHSPSSLRRIKTTNAAAPRGSILSWEQLATESSVTLGEEEIGSMLSDIPAPFRSGNISPSLSEIPESPFHSEMPSPSGYGSISQVLLPDVTPSPAVHHHSQHRFASDAHEKSAVDPAIVTLLRLQLASADNTAKERLLQMQAMEEEIHGLKEAHKHDVETLSAKLGYMEEQYRSTTDDRENTDQEHAKYTTSLEEQLREMQSSRESAVAQAVNTVENDMHAAKQTELEVQSRKWEVAACARAAATEWTTVADLAMAEIDLLQNNRRVLAVLLAELECARLKIKATV